VESVSPVWSEEEVEVERIIALDQPEYIPIVALPMCYSDGTRGLSVRFRLSDTERKAIAEGSDIVITELTFGNPFTPVDIKLCKPNERPY
jgi:hypothetical protein